MFRISAIAVLLASTASAGFAADTATAPAGQYAFVSAPSASWEGGYVGGQIGYAYGDFGINVGDFNNDSVIGGLTAGYLWSLGNGFYLGPEFQYDWANVTVTDPDTNWYATQTELDRLIAAAPMIEIHLR